MPLNPTLKGHSSHDTWVRVPVPEIFYFAKMGEFVSAGAGSLVPADQKLRNFHWNVEGSDFFELHEEFENEYNKRNVKD